MQKHGLYCYFAGRRTFGMAIALFTFVETQTHTWEQRTMRTIITIADAIGFIVTTFGVGYVLFTVTGFIWDKWDDYKNTPRF